MQMIMYAPKSDWKPPKISDLPSWKNCKLAGIDIETRDDFLKTLGPGVRRGAYIVGVSFYLDGGRSYYLPIRHAGGGNLPENLVIQYLRDQAKVFEGTLVGANLLYDLDFLEESGIIFNCIKVDVQVIEPLINELQLYFNLDSLCHKYNIPGKDETQLKAAAVEFGVHPKKELWKLHSMYVGEYAEGDAKKPVQVWLEQKKLIDKYNLWKIVNLEISVTPVLLKMRRRGVLISEDALDFATIASREKEQEFLDKIKYMTGVDVPLGSTMTTGPLVKALHHQGIDVPYKVKTNGKHQYSITKELLPTWGEVGLAILGARQACKIRDTFVKTIRDHMTNGRIHGIYKQIVTRDPETGQTGASFGRLAASNPNLQQLPARTKLGKLIKMCFIPEHGMLWATIDQSAQEPRWGTEYGVRLGLKGAKEALDDILRDAKWDPHQSMADMTGLSRDHGKTMRLAISYCQGGAKTARSLGLPTAWAYRGDSGWKTFETRTEAMQYRVSQKQGSVLEVAGEEAADIISRFNKGAPFIKGLSDAAIARAEEAGVIITDGGRNLHFEMDDNGRYIKTYKAGNKLIQGSSADQVKAGIVAVDKNLPHVFLQTQTHDDIGGSMRDIKEANDVAQCLEDVCDYTSVPWRCDIEVGPNMGSIEQVCNKRACCNMAVVGSNKKKFFCDLHEQEYVNERSSH